MQSCGQNNIMLCFYCCNGSRECLIKDLTKHARVGMVTHTYVPGGRCMLYFQGWLYVLQQTMGPHGLHMPAQMYASSMQQHLATKQY